MKTLIFAAIAVLSFTSHLQAEEPKSLQQRKNEASSKVIHSYDNLIQLIEQNGDSILKSRLEESQNAWEAYRATQAALVARSSTKTKSDHEVVYIGVYCEISAEREIFLLNLFRQVHGPFGE